MVVRDRLGNNPERGRIIAYQVHNHSESSSDMHDDLLAQGAVRAVDIAECPVVAGDR